MRLPRPVRRITDLVTRRIPVPIMSGVNRSLLWNLASAGSGHASGRRELTRMRVLDALIRPGDTVWDLGAHQGFVTLLASRRVGPSGTVYAFEPAHENRAVLRRHVRWNRLVNVHVLPFALGSFDGDATFGGGATSRMHALGQGDETVAVRTVSSLVGSGLPSPNFVKIDVEGAEAEVLAGAMSVLRSDTRLMIAMHSTTAYEACLALLRPAGFVVVESRALVTCRQGEWRGDPDAYFHGTSYAGADEDRRLLHALGL
ncbi:MAG TPA: FkbM family methyltransferase [Gemmatimonadaceae bacterium]|nr:FkbM family methyltransferase [Gemmatimonadaceae bacterium]